MVIRVEGSLFKLSQGVCRRLLYEGTGLADTAELCVGGVVVFLAVRRCCVLTEEA